MDSSTRTIAVWKFGNIASHITIVFPPYFAFVQQMIATCEESCFVLFITNFYHGGFIKSIEVNVRSRMNRWSCGHVFVKMTNFGKIQERQVWIEKISLRVSGQVMKEWERDDNNEFISVGSRCSNFIVFLKIMAEILISLSRKVAYQTWFWI